MSETHICLVLKSMPFYTVETQMMIFFFFPFPFNGSGETSLKKEVYVWLYATWTDTTS